MKRALQKIVKNGNSTQIAIARPMLIDLGWLPGQRVIVEMLDAETLRIRRPRESDFDIGNASGMLHGSTVNVTP